MTDFAHLLRVLAHGDMGVVYRAEDERLGPQVAIRGTLLRAGAGFPPYTGGTIPSPCMAPLEIGHYRITAKLGEGGMGEVYRATDPRLGRDIAVKVIPDALAKDPDRLARFRREARVLAALNHASIAAIYGMEESGGTIALVMELVPGDTLADRIARGPLPLAEALPIARQIVDAIDYAHAHGIVHRDLKPANIKITPDGTVKVLDFGLAKALAGDEDTRPGQPDAPPTLTAFSTHPGLVIGTPAYMSPEQARGQAAGKQSDIWAFGAVLFEMLTGRPAFAGSTVSDTLAAVLKSDPDWQLLPPDTPPPIRRVLRRCLERDPRLRLRDIGDAALDMQDALEPARETGPAASRRQPLWPAALAAASLAAALLFAFLLLRSDESTAASPAAVRFREVLPAGLELRPSSHSPTVAVSANGQRLAFVAGQRGEYELFHRGLDSDAAAVPSLRGDLKAPFLSPDGAWVAVFHSGKLRKYPVAGGSVETICDAPSGHGGAWSDRGTIVFTGSHTSGLSSVSERGGPVTTLTTPKFEDGELAHYWPAFLPDGETVLFTSARTTGATYNRARVEALSLNTGERRVVVENAYAARFLASGHLVYAQGGRLMVAPFDVGNLRVTGPASAVMESVRIDPLSPPDFGVSYDGLIAFVPGRMFTPEYRLVLADRSGAITELPDIKETYVESPAFSPDGGRVAFSAGLEGTDIWTYDLRRRVLARITTDGASTSPRWSPDGRHLFFISNRTGPSEIVMADVSGSAPPKVLVTRSNRVYNLSVRLDGRALLFDEYDPSRLGDVWLLPLEGDRTPQPVLQNAAFEWMPSFAPDGGSFAFSSSGAGSFEVYLQRLDGQGRRRVSTEGGESPIWSRNRELFYVERGRVLKVVELSEGAELVPGPPRTLMTLSEAGSTTPSYFYDVAPDGRSVAVVRQATAAPPATQFEVRLNWNPEARR